MCKLTVFSSAWSTTIRLPNSKHFCTFQTDFVPIRMYIHGVKRRMIHVYTCTVDYRDYRNAKGFRTHKSRASFDWNYLLFFFFVLLYIAALILLEKKKKEEKTGVQSRCNLPETAKQYTIYRSRHTRRTIAVYNIVRFNVYKICERSNKNVLLRTLHNIVYVHYKHQYYYYY